tara:strand:- start:1217 stop:1378 length:162 start_codon:yes stop_codon:yes gene_type:complete
MEKINKEDRAKLNADTMKSVCEHGRQDDLLIINFMAPGAQKDEPSNTWDPNAD